MKEHMHKLSAILPDRADVRAAYEVMKAAGFTEEQLFVVDGGESASSPQAEPQRETVPESAVQQLLTSVGLAEGVQSSEAKATTEEGGVIVFVSEPVLSTLIAAGHTAASTSKIGPTEPLPLSETDFVDLAKDAIRHGFRMLIARIPDSEQANTARALMGTLVRGETLT